jgi:hypothetical protein
MLLKRLFLISSVSTLIVGCAEFYGQQPPAPVYGNGAPIYGNNYPPSQEQAKTTTQVKQPAKETTEVVKTSPLQGTDSTTILKELKPEPLPPGQTLLTPAQEQELKALQKPVIPEPAIEQEPVPKKKPEPVIEQAKIQAVPEVVEEQESPATFQPLEAFSPMSPVVGSLVLAANEDNQKGNVESAATTLERASRIEPRNATLYYKMALLKLKSKPSLAEDLAKKSALLAANDTSLKKHSWLLVAKAREMQKDFKGAKEARAKASKF